MSFTSLVVLQHCPSLSVHPDVHEHNLAGAHRCFPGEQQDPAAVVLHCFCLPSGRPRWGYGCWSHGHHVGKVRSARV